MLLEEITLKHLIISLSKMYVHLDERVTVGSKKQEHGWKQLSLLKVSVSALLGAI